MAVTVVVPYRSDGCPHRERALEFVKACYAARYPDWEVVLGEAEPGPWCKATAVMPALRRAENEAVVVADADVWSNGIASAVRAVVAGAAEWAMPHKMVYRLDEESTLTWTSQSSSKESTQGLDYERRPYEGVWGGGIVVAHRDTLLNVPLDPRFKGAGHEDEAWGIALETLVGPGWRGDADLIHLHHPPLPRISPRHGSQESYDLFRRYAMANRNPEAMRSLIEEFNVISDPDKSTSNHRPPLAVG